jgi:hypothetical protein
MTERKYETRNTEIRKQRTMSISDFEFRFRFLSMNPRQTCVLFLGIIIFTLMGLFPPVNHVYEFKEVNAEGEVLDVQEVISSFQGYRYYFSLGPLQDGQGYRVAKLILMAQWLLLVVIVRVLMVALRDPKALLPRGKLFQRPPSPS